MYKEIEELHRAFAVVFNIEREILPVFKMQ
jgi:hypothetical protein